MRPSRRGPAVGAVLCAALGIILCAAVPSGSWAATRPRSGSAATTTPCSSADFVLSITSASTPSAALTVTGQLDFSHAAATATVTFPAALPIPSLSGLSEDVVLVGGILYLSVPPSLQSYVGGAPWVSVSLPSAASSAVDGLGTLLADWCGSGQSLSNLLGNRGVSTTPLGSSSVGGVPVTGTARTGKGRRLTKLSKLARRLDSYVPSVGGRTPVTFDTWVDPQGQVLQLSADLGSFAVALTFSNVDLPVSITAPAGAVPLPGQALGLLGGFFGG